LPWGTLSPCRRSSGANMTTPSPRNLLERKNLKNKVQNHNHSPKTRKMASNPVLQTGLFPAAKDGGSVRFVANTTLWHGLLTMPQPLTEALLLSARRGDLRSGQVAWSGDHGTTRRLDPGRGGQMCGKGHMLQRGRRWPVAELWPSGSRSRWLLVCCEYGYA